MLFNTLSNRTNSRVSSPQNLCSTGIEF